MAAKSTPDPLEAVRIRTSAYYYQDGINEIGMGIGSIGGAGTSYMVHHMMTTKGDAWMAVAVGFAALAISMLDGRITRWLRERYSYPRIGYLSDRPGEPVPPRMLLTKILVMTFFTLLPLALIVYLMNRHDPTEYTLGWARWFPFVAGPFMFGGSWLDYERFKLNRLPIAGFLTFIAGLFATSVFKQPFLACAVFMALHSVIKLVSGGVALTNLVRTVPVVAE